MKMPEEETDLSFSDEDNISFLLEDGAGEDEREEMTREENTSLSSEIDDKNEQSKDVQDSTESIKNEKEVPDDRNESEAARISPTEKHASTEKKSVKKTTNGSVLIALALITFVISFALCSLMTHQNHDREAIGIGNAMNECISCDEETSSSSENFNSVGNKTGGGTAEEEAIRKNDVSNSNLTYKDAVFAAQHHSPSLLTILNVRPDLIHHVDANNWTLLHEAVRSGKIESVSAVLPFILNMNDKHESKDRVESVVQLARSLGHGAVADFLVSAVGASVTDVLKKEDYGESDGGEDSKNGTDAYTYMEAVFATHYFPSLLLMMLRRRPDFIHHTDVNNWTLLHEAVRSGRAESLSIVLPFFLYMKDEEERKLLAENVLWVAESLGRDKIARLLTATALVDDLENTNEAGAIFTYDEALLAVHHNPSLLMIILSKHLDFLYHVDADNWTLLHEAIRVGNLESVSVVLAFTLSISDDDCENHDESALILARTLGHGAIADVLVDTGVLGVPNISCHEDIEDDEDEDEDDEDSEDIAFTYDDALYAIHYEPAYVKLILSQNPEFLSVTDENGWTLLHEAVRGSRIESVSSILSFVDDTNYLNKRTTIGGNAMWFAKMFGHEEIVEILEARGGVELPPEHNSGVCMPED